MSYPIKFHPLTGWPDAFTKNRTQSLFQVTYSATRDDLERELRAVSARNVCIYLDVTESQIRLDRELRADAKPGHPGVMLTFTTPGQDPNDPTELHCDTYVNWHHNLRGIVLSLEALRGVARWGVSKRNQQYQGFKLVKASAPPLAKAVPAADQLFGSVAEAVRFLGFVCESQNWGVDLSNRDVIDEAVEMARTAAQSPAQSRLVEAAIVLIKGTP